MATDVAVREGRHDGFTRLVFDWPSSVSYDIQEQGSGSYIISFNQDAELDDSELKGQSITNLQNLELLSSSPLKVKLTLPAKASLKPLALGDRVIFDLYDPPSGAVTPDKPYESAQREKVAPTQVVSAPTPSQAALKSVAPKSNAAPKAPAKPVENSQPKTAAAITPKEAIPSPANVKTISLKANSEPTLMTLSSSTSFGVAAFEQFGKIWLIADREDPLLTPQISGENAPAFGALQTQSIENGKAFSAALPEQTALKYKGQGGGILWRLFIAPDVSVPDSIEPIRTGVDPLSPRGGRIIWPLQSSAQMLELDDPALGGELIVITVKDTKDFTGRRQDYVDFTVLPSPIGMAIKPKVDDLKVRLVRGGVEISRPTGLAISEESRAKMARRTMQSKANKMALDENNPEQRIYEFESWKMGGPSALQENRTVILSRIADLSGSERAENLMMMAKAYLANNMAAESIGMLNFAKLELPGIEDTPEFKALRGAANALNWKSADAFEELSGEVLRKFPEINLWRAYTLADLGDWQQAAKVLPPNALSLLYGYPPIIQSRLALSAAEVRLRSGDIKNAGLLLDMVEENARRISTPLRSELAYLKGEKARQQGDQDKTIDLWLKLAKGDDDLYRVKSSLALTRLLFEDGKLSARRSIDKLEGLRYAWRGDDLEANVNYWLGNMYFNEGQFVKGLNIMRDATTYTTNPILAQRIANDMSDSFVNLFTDEGLENVTPLDAVTLYEQFSELVPPSERGNRLVEKLAEHLVKADLLDRAGSLLDYQVKHRLEGYDLFRTAMRLAAIRLIDERPDDAMAAIETAEAKYKELPEELQTENNKLNLTLLRARALSKQGRPDQALAMLQDMKTIPDVNRLRAEIAWGASYWDDSAEALDDVIKDQNISLTRPLSEENASLILRRAIALNLGNDRVALANMRERYTESMLQTEKAKIFEIISRPRQNITLADRETLLSIVSEVDLFADILDGLKNGQPQ